MIEDELQRLKEEVSEHESTIGELNKQLNSANDQIEVFKASKNSDIPLPTNIDVTTQTELDNNHPRNSLQDITEIDQHRDSNSCPPFVADDLSSIKCSIQRETHSQMSPSTFEKSRSKKTVPSVSSSAPDTYKLDSNNVAVESHCSFNDSTTVESTIKSPKESPKIPKVILEISSCQSEKADSSIVAEDDLEDQSKVIVSSSPSVSASPLSKVPKLNENVLNDKCMIAEEEARPRITINTFSTIGNVTWKTPEKLCGQRLGNLSQECSIDSKSVKRDCLRDEKEPTVNV